MATGTMKDPIGDALYLALGKVAAEAARLDYWVASLVMHLDGLTDDEARKLLAQPGKPLKRLQAAVRRGAEPRVALTLAARSAASCFRDRGAVLHSVAMIEESEDPETPDRVVFWHPKTDRDLEQLDAANLRQLAFDIARTARLVARLTDEVADPARIAEAPRE